jgi:WXXGXW repeat (2 copies)
MYAKFVHRALLITLLAVAYPAASFAGFFGVGVTVGFAPPPLPVYVQPPCPASGYIWTPGYWAYSGDDQDYYRVPGTWVLAPSFGWLWTPGYWGLIDAEYVWHEGYWGPHVGFYGGINYGFGYFGSGFVGGFWRDHDFYYNRSVTNVSNPQNSSSWGHEQHAQNASAAQHAGYGPNRVRAPAADSRATVAHWSPPQSYRPPAPNRVSPSPSNAPSAPHGYSQPPHVSRQAPSQSQRRG